VRAIAAALAPTLEHLDLSGPAPPGALRPRPRSNSDGYGSDGDGDGVGDADLLALAPLSRLSTLQLCCWYGLTDDGIAAWAKACERHRGASGGSAGGAPAGERSNRGEDAAHPVHCTAAAAAAIEAAVTDAADGRHGGASANADWCEGCEGWMSDAMGTDEPEASTFGRSQSHLSVPASPLRLPAVPSPGARRDRKEHGSCGSGVLALPSIGSSPRCTFSSPSDNFPSPNGGAARLLPAASPKKRGATSSSTPSATSAAVHRSPPRHQSPSHAPSLRAAGGTGPPRAPGLRGLNLAECRGLGDGGVGATLDAFGPSLVDLCVHGCPSLTGTWLRALRSGHALRRRAHGSCCMPGGGGGGGRGHFVSFGSRAQTCSSTVLLSLPPICLSLSLSLLFPVGETRILIFTDHKSSAVPQI